jgi:signal transduction histidine kinase
VSVASDRAPDGAARVTVRNSGTAIPPAEVDRLFEPFQRLPSDRVAAPRATGQGLGLSIVRSIVRAHGGTLTATPNPEGGLAITVTLPVRAAPVPGLTGSGA